MVSVLDVWSSWAPASRASVSSPSRPSLRSSMPTKSSFPWPTRLPRHSSSRTTPKWSIFTPSMTMASITVTLMSRWPRSSYVRFAMGITLSACSMVTLVYLSICPTERSLSPGLRATLHICMLASRPWTVFSPRLGLTHLVQAVRLSKPPAYFSRTGPSLQTHTSSSSRLGVSAMWTLISRASR